MIVRARAVVTMDGTPIENGAVAVSGDRIVDVGRFPEVSACYSGEEIIDLGEQVLLPGLINAHCHLDYTCLRGKIAPSKSFTDWIRAINAEKAKLSPQDYVTSINEGFAEAKRYGTTTIANLTAFPELIQRLPVAPIRTWWFAELIDVRSLDRANQLVDRAVELLESEPNYGLAPHALFTASKSLYQRCEEAAENLLLTTHLAESPEEMEMFRDASGPLYDVAFFDLLEIAEENDANFLFFKIQRQTTYLVGKLKELTGHYFFEAMNLSNAVTNFNDSANLHNGDASLEILNLLANDFVNFACLNEFHYCFL